MKSMESLGRSQHAYRELFRNSLDLDDIHKIQQGTRYNHPVADDRFCRMIEEKYGIKVGKIRGGRPPKRRI
ncbi:MAG: hypothetical protein CMN84_08660 [Spongiibacteraceae bacterium]|nr:hypothetical protein [Spongiibacteraceae bacterium]